MSNTMKTLQMLLGLIVISSTWIGHCQAQGIIFEFTLSNYIVTIDEDTPIGSNFINLGVTSTGINEQDVVFSIEAVDPPEGEPYFALSQGGFLCHLHVQQNLKLANFNSYQMIVKAEHLIEGLTTFASCTVEIDRSDRDWCATIMNVTVNSDIKERVYFHMPCYFSSWSNIGILKLPELDVQAQRNGTSGEVIVNPPINCGVSYRLLEIEVVTADQTWTINLHIHVNRIPPKSNIQLTYVTVRSAEFLINILLSQSRLQECWQVQFINNFVFEVVTSEGSVVINDNLVATNNTLNHNAQRLLPEQNYIASFTIRGPGYQSISPPLQFKTKELFYESTPLVVSSASHIVEVGVEFFLTCKFPEEHAVTFKWFLNGSQIQGASSVKWLTSPKFSDAGFYRCEVSDAFGWKRSSNDYSLSVRKKADIFEITVTTIYDWGTSLSSDLFFNKSSLFLLTALYVEHLVDDIMSDIPSYHSCRVDSFGPGSQLRSLEIVSITLVERTPNPTPSTNINLELARRWQSGYETPKAWTSDNVFGISMEVTSPGTLPIIEGTSVQISAKFVIVHSRADHQFDISWLLDEDVIQYGSSETFFVNLDKTTIVNNDIQMDISPLHTYFYNITLDIANFQSRHKGRYSCVLSTTTTNGNFPTEAKDSLYTDIQQDEILKRPQVFINPLSVYVKRDTMVSVTCRFSNVNKISFIDQRNTVIMSYISEMNEGTKELTINSSVHTRIKCQGVNSAFPHLVEDSEFMTIYFVDIIQETVECPAGVDSRGIEWRKTLAGITVEQLCPQNYTGYASRQCGDDGVWFPINFINCTRIEWTLAKEEIKKVKQDGLEVTSQFVNNLASDISTGINEDIPVLSGDIQQVADILADVSSLVIGSEEANLVDQQSLENFASVTDQLFSSTDTEWEEVLTNEENTTTGVGSGFKIVKSMDQLVASSLGNATHGSNVPIVKGKIAIKTNTLVVDDINFPDPSEYSESGNWVIEFGYEAFLSRQAFGERDIGYATILMRDVASQMPVSPKRQNLHESGRPFQDKQVASDVLSFSLSKEIKRLSPPLRLRFNISQKFQENLTEPLCGFLDETVSEGSIWSGDGCHTEVLESGVVQCSCDHLTNFAILMSPSGSSKKHHEILAMITYIGCGISAVCLLITLGVHAVVWRFVKNDRIHLHIHLIFCLILSYIIFLAGVDRTEYSTLCTVVAALLHYIFLVVFFLMLGEGIHILLSVSFVFHQKSSLRKLLVLAYGTPLVIVGICLAVTQTDDYRSDDFCWLDRHSGLLWAFAGPALMVILVNFIVFVLVAKAILRDKSMTTIETQSETKSMMRAVCFLSPILGLSWVFGIVSVNDDLVIFQYLFAIFNSLQGFFIFLFYCVFSTQIRNALRARTRRRKSLALDSLTPKTNSTNDTSQARKMSAQVEISR